MEQEKLYHGVRLYHGVDGGDYHGGTKDSICNMTAGSVTKARKILCLSWQYGRFLRGGRRGGRRDSICIVAA